MITNKSGEGAKQELGMASVDSLEVPPWWEVSARTGGNHLMVMGLKNTRRKVRKSI